MASLDTEGVDDNKSNKEEHAPRQISESNSVYLDATKDSAAFSNIDIDEKSYYLAKYQDQQCKDGNHFIQIHELRHYKLSWDYKCEKNCSFQVYIKCFDECKKEIETFHIARFGEPVIIKGVDNDNKTIKCEGDLSGWMPTNYVGSARIIGFNYNAQNIDDKVMADDYIQYNGSLRDTGKNAGAYSYIDNKNKIIKLSLEMPEHIKKRILPSRTVIRNHFWASTWASYEYLSIFTHDNVVRDNKWRQAQHLLKGVSNTFDKGANTEQFRKGTQFVKLGIRRYGKSSGSIWFNHVKLEQVEIR